MPSASASFWSTLPSALPLCDNAPTKQKARGHCLGLNSCTWSSLAGKAAFRANLPPRAFGALGRLLGKTFGDLRQRVPNLHAARDVLWRVLPKFFKAVRVLRREQHQAGGRCAKSAGFASREKQHRTRP